MLIKDPDTVALFAGAVILTVGGVVSTAGLAVVTSTLSRVEVLSSVFVQLVTNMPM
jgi:hypothetical protein